MYRITEHVRKIYVRPIMKPYPSGVDTTDEYIPDNILFVDKLHECVRRLFEPVAGRVSPSIKVINLSIGIPERLLDVYKRQAKALRKLRHPSRSKKLKDFLN